MTKKKTKRVVVNYFPRPTHFFNKLSPHNDDVDVDDDDVQPSKIPKLSGIEKEKEKGDCSSGDEREVDNYYLRPHVTIKGEKGDNYYYLNPDSDMMIKGKKLDLVSYLSSRNRDFLVDKSGEKVSVKSAIQGKYVILMWLELPVRSWTFEGYTCWALRSALSTTSNWSTNVQLVLIPSGTPPPGWQETQKEQAFYSFLSGLPSCLAIPLWDSNFVTATATAPARHGSFCLRTAVLDPNQTVLQEDCSYNLWRFGADSYPFTDDRFLTLREMGRALFKEKPFPLERLLGLDVSDCLSNLAGDAKIAVSELKQKLVGVFVTFHFTIFDAVHQAYQDCLAKGRQLEIVLACVNLADDPQHYMDSVYAALRDSDKGKEILSSWWLLPYDDSTQRRLWKLLNNLHRGGDECIEELIIVGPQGEFFDPKTLCAISNDPSIHDMYPYAIQVVAQQETARLQKLTLESLFEDSLLVTQQGNLVPVTELRGKNVLLFIADLEQGYNWIMDRMRDYWCPEIKSKCKLSNTAVVFVPLHSSGLNFTKDLDQRMSWLWDPTMSWLISPPNAVREALIVKALSLKGHTRLDQLSCVAFGEDGRFVSNNLYDLSEYIANDLPPDHLYYDVLEQYFLIFNKDERERWMLGYYK